jgi:hypothetical protein
MKVELDISESIMELMQEFKVIASTVIDKEQAIANGVNIDDLADLENINGIANVLLYAGLNHFREELERRTKPAEMVKKVKEERVGSFENANKPAISFGRMFIGANGVEIDGNVPEEIRAALQGAGEALREGLSDAMDTCECPNCQLRRSQPVKGKFS